MVATTMEMAAGILITIRIPEGTTTVVITTTMAAEAATAAAEEEEDIMTILAHRTTSKSMKIKTTAGRMVLTLRMTTAAAIAPIENKAMCGMRHVLIQ